jgi:long-chain acyl-CoA synthetase
MESKKYDTLIEMLEFQSDHNGHEVAFTFQNLPYTFSQMWESINLFAAYLLNLGLSPGDRVVLTLPNSAEFFSAFYGIQRIGGTAVPIFPGSGPERIFSIAHLCSAQLIVAPSSLPDDQIAGYKEMANK